MDFDTQFRGHGRSPADCQSMLTTVGAALCSLAAEECGPLRLLRLLRRLFVPLLSTTPLKQANVCRMCQEESVASVRDSGIKRAGQAGATAPPAKLAKVQSTAAAAARGGSAGAR